MRRLNNLMVIGCATAIAVIALAVAPSISSARHHPAAHHSFHFVHPSSAPPVRLAFAGGCPSDWQVVGC
jgi:hypothetical protein